MEHSFSLQRIGCHAFKLCTEFERNSVIYGWVIHDLARFRRAILGSGARTNEKQYCLPVPVFLRPNLRNTFDGHPLRVQSSW